MSRVSKSLDPDQAQQIVGPDPDPNCLQRLSAEDNSRKGVKFETCVNIFAIEHVPFVDRKNNRVLFTKYCVNNPQLPSVKMESMQLTQCTVAQW